MINQKCFSIDQQVRITDLNYGSHLGIPNLSSMAHNARFCFLKSIGLSEADIGGPSIMAIESTISLKKECFVGDILTFNVTFDVFSKTRLKCNILVYKDATLVATVEDTLTCFDYSKGKPAAVPETFKSIILTQ